MWRVGGLLAQIAMARGAHVIGTVSPRENLPAARQSGIADVIVRSEQRMADAAHELTDGRGVNVVFEHRQGHLSRRLGRAATARLPDLVRSRKWSGSALRHARAGPRWRPVPHPRKRRPGCCRSISLGTGGEQLPATEALAALDFWGFSAPDRCPVVHEVGTMIYTKNAVWPVFPGLCEWARGELNPHVLTDTRT